MGHTHRQSRLRWGSGSLQDVTDPDTLTISDRWVTREDLDAHVRSGRIPPASGGHRPVGDPPDISFDDLEHIGGFDLVQALRAPQSTSQKDNGT